MYHIESICKYNETDILLFLGNLFAALRGYSFTYLFGEISDSIKYTI